MALNTRMSTTATTESRAVPLVTLTLWVFCLGVGVTGLVWGYPMPEEVQTPPPPVEAELVQIQLTSDPLPPVHTPTPAAFEPPTPLEIAPLPDAPPMIAVAEPTPAIAFALPVEQPAPVVNAALASHAVAPAETFAAPLASPPVQTLTFGRGEGRQPAPEYPREAMRQGQEGAVEVRFTVGEHGRVVAAEVSEPCRWSLLNHAALSAVRDRWRFPSGVERVYKVSIRFAFSR